MLKNESKQCQWLAYFCKKESAVEASEKNAKQKGNGSHPGEKRSSALKGRQFQCLADVCENGSAIEATKKNAKPRSGLSHADPLHATRCTPNIYLPILGSFSAIAENKRNDWKSCQSDLPFLMIVFECMELLVCAAGLSCVSIILTSQVHSG
jgi:hypothetical protein